MRAAPPALRRWPAAPPDLAPAAAASVSYHQWGSCTLHAPTAADEARPLTLVPTACQALPSALGAAWARSRPQSPGAASARALLGCGSSTAGWLQARCARAQVADEPRASRASESPQHAARTRMHVEAREHPRKASALAGKGRPYADGQDAVRVQSGRATPRHLSQSSTVSDERGPARHPRTATTSRGEASSQLHSVAYPKTYDLSGSRSAVLCILRAAVLSFQ
jgi:hypothetical protein